MDQNKYVIVIHGGCGVISKDSMDEQKQKAFEQILTEAVEVGYKVLSEGGTSLDAVEAAVVVMEDSPLFNAGKGAVFTNDEKHELDASIMEGSKLQAGAVCGISRTKNPIKLAKAVMKQTQHVFLAGNSADDFAQNIGLEMVDNSYFNTPYRLEQIRTLKSISQEKCTLDHFDVKSLLNDKSNKPNMGTVGAVALDIYGNLAAATSTGGMTNKKYGRVGDSPLIGSGTYADNNTCAVSCTGHGEVFIRLVIAHECSALIKYGGRNLSQACQEAIDRINTIKDADGGGLIAVDRQGNITMPFNTIGMYRGWKINNQPTEVRIYE